MQCDLSDCEIARTLAALNEGQIRVTVFAAVCSLVLSVGFGVMAAYLHWYGIVHSQNVAIPWWMLSIMGAPFGAEFVLKVRQKVPWKIAKGE